MTEYRYYITDSNPNGTADLIVSDEDGTVVQYHIEAVFWPTTMRSDATFCLCDGESIFGSGRDIGEEHDDIPPDYYCWEVDIEDVLKRIAVSPCTDGKELIRELNRLGGK